jgi:hypothetical protein
VFLKMQQFLLPEDREEAFKPLRIFMDETLRTLRNTSKENYVTNRKDLEVFRTQPWGKTMNMLPDEFYDYKNELQTDMINLTVSIQNFYRADCLEYSKNMMIVGGIDKDLQRLARDNHNVFVDNEKVSSSGDFKWWHVIWIVLIIIRIIIAVARN